MSSTNHTADDSDLEDLLGAGGKADKHIETAPLNLDHLTQGHLDVSPRNARRGSVVGAFFNLMQAHCSYLCYANPMLCSCTVVMGIILGMFLMANVLFNPTETFGVIQNDYTNIQSQYDLSLGKIDHWCLKGDNDSCRCEDPLEPTSRAEFKTWVTAHKGNKQVVESWRDSDMLDVVFLGESIVEEMDGRWMGKTHTDQLTAMEKIFKKRFTKEKSGINGVALGVAGDTSPNVLWRLLHGEMPDDFNPSIWWISLGMNDIGRMQCSEEVVVMGILRVVEEILTKKPDTRIVINSMLPMADLRGGIYPHVADYRDAFRPLKGQKGKQSVPVTHIARGSNVEGNIRTGMTVPTTTKKTKPTDERTIATKSKPDTRLLKKKMGAEEHSSDEEEPNNPDRVKKTLRKIPREKFHPKIDASQTRIRKYDATKGFLRQHRMPLWTSISAVNRELRKFCEKHDQVTFFDATSLFTERDEGSKSVLLSERITVRGHPTVEGYTVWEEAILEKVKKMVAKIQSEKTQQTAAAEAAVAAEKSSGATDDFDDDYEDAEDSSSDASNHSGGSASAEEGSESAESAESGSSDST